MSESTAVASPQDKWWRTDSCMRILNSSLPGDFVDSVMLRLHQVFDPDWCGRREAHPVRFYLHARGTIPFAYLFELACDLSYVSECLRFPSLVDDLRKAALFSSSRLELQIAAGLVRSGQLVDFRPPLASGRRADLLSHDSSHDLFIEVKETTQSVPQASLQTLNFSLITALSDLQRTEPWKSFADMGFQVEVSDTTLGLLGAGGDVDEATISGVTRAVVAEVKERFAKCQPPFEFDVDQYARVRIAPGAQCTLGGPPYAPEVELKRILQKHFKAPIWQLSLTKPGILVIRSCSVLDDFMTRTTLSPLLAKWGQQASHLSAVLFLPVFTSFPVHWSMFRAFAVVNPAARFPADELPAYRSLCRNFGIEN